MRRRSEDQYNGGNPFDSHLLVGGVRVRKPTLELIFSSVPFPAFVKYVIRANNVSISVGKLGSESEVWSGGEGRERKRDREN